MLSATTPVPSAVSATFVAARPPALHARVPLLGRIRQAASAALVVFCLLRPSTDLSTATGNPKDSPTDTILTPRLFRRTISALTKSFLTRTSISSVTPKPALPSCPLLASSSLSLPPTPMSRPNFLLLCLVVGSVQPFSFGGLSAWRAVVSLMFFSLCLEG